MAWAVLAVLIIGQALCPIALMWMLAAIDGGWPPFGPRYTVVKLDGQADRKAERADPTGGADGVQDVVRVARHDGEPRADGTYPHVQRSSAEDGRSGNGEAAPEHREGGASEGRSVQGAGMSDGAGFRVELERRAAAAGFRR